MSKPTKYSKKIITDNKDDRDYYISSEDRQNDLDNATDITGYFVIGGIIIFLSFLLHVSQQFFGSLIN